MLKHNLSIESGSIGTDMVGNRLVYQLVDKDASRLPEIVRLTITLFECPCLGHLRGYLGHLRSHLGHLRGHSGCLRGYLGN